MKIISLEGNIGSGKSTLLKMLKNKLENVVFLDEPVNEWQTIKDSSGKNILDLFYSDKEKYSFPFQILAYITRLRLLLKEIKKNEDKTIIIERSIYTDKYVFAKMLYEKKFINEIEWKSYNHWFDTFKDETKLDTIIWVNTKPEICYERVKKRNRKAEETLSLDYLNSCHLKHLEWIESNNDNVKIIIFDGNKEFEDNENLLEKMLLNNQKVLNL